MPESTVTRITEEVTERPEDLVELTSDNVKTVVASLRRPGGRPDSEAGRTVPISYLRLGTKQWCVCKMLATP